MKMHVQEPIRVITLELDSATAAKMADWISMVGQPVAGTKKSAPHEMNELYGALKSIADNRGYGGH